MNTNERRPLLSDEDAGKMAFLGQERYGKFITLRSIALVIRDFYEDLITSGKLRVVEEVDGEAKGNIEGRWLHCSGCNEVWSTNAYSYCPGCGSKILRQ